MILKFINREKELGFLNERYRSRTAEFIPMYGRRRVGKTQTIKQFIQDKPHFYFLARKRDPELEMKPFAEKISRKFNVFLDRSDSWEGIFEGIAKKIIRNSRRKFLIIIDEFPYWIEKDKSIVSEFQYAWDEILSKENVFLILCGSSVSMMETDVIGYKSPLYGRRTGQIKLGILSFKNFTKFFPNLDMEEIMKLYGSADGIPFYIKEFDPKKRFMENIGNTFWQSKSILNAEAEFLLKEELREVEKYLSIMRSVFGGSTKLNEIASKSRVDITNINKYLNTLINLGFMRKESPVIVNRPKRKNYIYRISDNYFRFWLSYVYPFQSDIEIDETDSLLDFFKRDYPSYMGHVFEDICAEFLINIRDRRGLQFNKIGRWWEKDKEIDLVGINSETRQILFVECKWKAGVNPEKVLRKLKEKAGFVDWNNDSRKERYCIIAKSFRSRPKLKNCLLFDLKDIEKTF